MKATKKTLRHSFSLSSCRFVHRASALLSFRPGTDVELGAEGSEGAGHGGGRGADRGMGWVGMGD